VSALYMCVCTHIHLLLWVCCVPTCEWAHSWASMCSACQGVSRGRLRPTPLQVLLTDRNQRNTGSMVVWRHKQNTETSWRGRRDSPIGKSENRKKAQSGSSLQPACMGREAAHQGSSLRWGLSLS
jgi:hypothetical protein